MLEGGLQANWRNGYTAGGMVTSRYNMYCLWYGELSCL